MGEKQNKTNRQKTSKNVPREMRGAKGRAESQRRTEMREPGN